MKTTIDNSIKQTNSVNKEIREVGKLLASYKNKNFNLKESDKNQTEISLKLFKQDQTKCSSTIKELRTGSACFLCSPKIENFLDKKTKKLKISQSVCNKVIEDCIEPWSLAYKINKQAESMATLNYNLQLIQKGGEKQFSDFKKQLQKSSQIFSVVALLNNLKSNAKSTPYWENQSAAACQMLLNVVKANKDVEEVKKDEKKFDSKLGKNRILRNVAIFEGAVLVNPKGIDSSIFAGYDQIKVLIKVSVTRGFSSDQKTRYF